jgi:hypothetical protein
MFAVTSLCAVFGSPTGDFRLALLPYSMIFALQCRYLAGKSPFARLRPRLQARACRPEPLLVRHRILRHHLTMFEIQL